MSNHDDAFTSHPTTTVMPDDEQVVARARELYADYAESQHTTPAEPERQTAPRRTRTKTSRASRRGLAHAPAPMHDEIALRAYQLYEQSGCQPGREVEFWLEAERQLTGAHER